MLLDDVAPTYDISSRHTIWVAAEPAHVYDAARHADLARPWLVRVLMALRVTPAKLATLSRGNQPAVQPADQCSVGSVPFTLIAETPGQEFVLGIMGRFWALTGGVVAAHPDRFRQLPPIGLAQGFWNFRVEPSGAGTELSTETRVRCGDAATRRQLARYWRIIRLGSDLIRRSMLRYIRRRAENPR